MKMTGPTDRISSLDWVEEALGVSNRRSSPGPQDGAVARQGHQEEALSEAGTESEDDWDSYSVNSNWDEEETVREVLSQYKAYKADIEGSDRWNRQQSKLHKLLYMRGEHPMLAFSWRYNFKMWGVSPEVYAKPESKKRLAITALSNEFKAAKALEDLFDLSLQIKRWEDLDEQARIPGTIVKTLNKYIGWAKQDAGVADRDFPAIVFVEAYPLKFFVTRAKAKPKHKRRRVKDEDKDYVESESERGDKIEPKASKRKRLESHEIKSDPDQEAHIPPSSKDSETELHEEEQEPLAQDKEHQTTETVVKEEELEDNKVTERGGREETDLDEDDEESERERRNGSMTTGPVAKDIEAKLRRLAEQHRKDLREKQANGTASWLTAPVLYAFAVIEHVVLLVSLDSGREDSPLVALDTVTFNQTDQWLWNALSIALPVNMARDEMHRRKDLWPRLPSLPTDTTDD